VAATEDLYKSNRSCSAQHSSATRRATRERAELGIKDLPSSAYSSAQAEQRICRQGSTAGCESIQHATQGLVEPAQAAKRSCGTAGLQAVVHQAARVLTARGCSSPHVAQMLIRDSNSSRASWVINATVRHAAASRNTRQPHSSCLHRLQTKSKCMVLNCAREGKSRGKRGN